MRERRFDGAAPLIAIDQEGGRVVTLARRHRNDAVDDGAGRGGRCRAGTRAGEQTGVRLAPRRLHDGFGAGAGSRARSGQYRDRHALAWVRIRSASRRSGAPMADGLQRGGVLPCYKHFPGHGSTAVDSHARAARRSKPMQRRCARAISCRLRASRGARRAIMGAHAGRVRAFDAERPATLSRDRRRHACGARWVLPARSSPTACRWARPRGSAAALSRRLRRSAPEPICSWSAAIANSHDGWSTRNRAGGSGWQRCRSRACRRRTNASFVCAGCGAPALPLDAFPPHPGIGREIARRAVTLVRGAAARGSARDVAVRLHATARPASRPSRGEAPALDVASAGLEPEDGKALLDRIAREPPPSAAARRRAHLHAGAGAGDRADSRTLSGRDRRVAVASRSTFRSSPARDTYWLPTATMPRASAGWPTCFSEGVPRKARCPWRSPLASEPFCSRRRTAARRDRHAVYRRRRAHRARRRARCSSERTAPRATTRSRGRSTSIPASIWRRSRNFSSLRSRSAWFQPERSASTSRSVRVFPEWQRRRTRRSRCGCCLAHTSGMNSGADYRTILGENVERFALSATWSRAPSATVVYSDLGFIAARRGDRASDASLAGRVYAPRRSVDRRSATGRDARARAAIPATEDDEWRGRVQGLRARREGVSHGRRRGARRACSERRPTWRG